MLNANQLKQSMLSFKNFEDTVERPSQKTGLMDTGATAQSGTSASTMLGSLAKYVGGLFESSPAIEATAVQADTTTEATPSMGINGPLEFGDMEKGSSPRIQQEEVGDLQISGGFAEGLGNELSKLGKVWAEQQALSKQDPDLGKDQDDVLGSFGDPKAGAEAIDLLKGEISKGEGTTDADAKKQGEGLTGYDIVYGYGEYGKPEKPLTEMTMAEVEAYQRQLIDATRGKIPGQDSDKGTSAVGKYQLTFSNLFGKGGSAANPTDNSWMKKAGITADTKFTPEVQERLADVVLREAGLNKYLSDGNMQAFQDRLSGKWASIAKSDGSGTYKGQAAPTTIDILSDIMSNMRSSKLRPRARPSRPGTTPQPTGLMVPPRPRMRP